jgi:phage/plasmid-like protein (TIGR03299 family)
MPDNVQTMFSGRGIIPWHKLGTIVEGTLTSAEAIKTAGLDWTVTKHPIFARIPDKDDLLHGKFKRVDSLYATTRDDTQHPLGVVGARYQPIQNADGFAVLDTLAKDGAAKFDTAGSLGLGETVWMLMLAERELNIAGDKLLPYFLATMAHDGSGRLKVRNVATRVVCANTLAAAMGENVTREVAISHIANYQTKIAQASKILKLMDESNTALVATSDQLLAQPYSRKQFERLVATIMAPPDPQDPTVTDRQCKSWEQRFDQLIKCYNTSDLDNVRDTAWGALNAIADFEQHVQRAKGSDTEKLETLFKRSFLQPQMASKAFEVLTA